MPCGCFGKKSPPKGVKRENDAKLKEEDSVCPPILPTVVANPEFNGRTAEDDPSKTAKRRDVVASYYEDQCALLGYRETGSRPPSSCVDSPSRTPSTAPLAPSPSPPSSSGSPSSPRYGASCRAELAQMRREFFKDIIVEAERNVYSKGYRGNASSTTLPTVARARQFGEVRPVRPVSQPSPVSSPPTAPSPPGPHLLRPTPPSSKTEGFINNEHSIGFSSPEFLRELKNASEEMSRKWIASSIDEMHQSRLPQEYVVPVSNSTHEEDNSRLSDSSPVTPPASPTTAEDESQPLLHSIEREGPITVSVSVVSCETKTSSLGHLEDDDLDQKGVLIEEPSSEGLPLDGSCSSSQVITESQISVESTRESCESTGPASLETSPHNVQSTEEYIGEDDDVSSIEEVKPEDIYLYETERLEPASFPGTPETHQEDQSTIPLNEPLEYRQSRNLEPIEETENSLHDPEESVALLTQSSFTGSDTRDNASMESMETSEPTKSKEHSSDSEIPEHILEYEKPAKISKTSDNVSLPDLDLNDERFIVRQSSSDVD